MWPVIAGAAVVLALGVVIYLKVRADANQSLDFATEQTKQAEATLDATRAANTATYEQARKELNVAIDKAMADADKRAALLKLLTSVRGTD